MGDQDTKAATQSRDDRLWTGTFILIVTLTFLAFLVAQAVNSSISVFVDVKGGSATFSGVLAAVFSWSAAAGRIIAGPLIDRYGRRVCIIGGFTLLLVGLVGPLLSTAAAPFIIWRVLEGVGFAMATSAASTAGADVLALSRLGEGVGYQGLGQAVAMSIGPAIALWLVGTDPAENVFIGLIIVGAVALVLAFTCTYERHPERLPHTSAYYQRAMKAAQARKTAEDGGTSAEAEAEVEAAVEGACAMDAREGAAPEAQPAGKAGGAAAVTGASESGWRRFFEPKAVPGMLPVLILSPLFGFSIYFNGLYATTIDVGNSGLYFTLSALAMIVVRISGKRFMDSVGPLWLQLVATACGIVAVALLMGAAQVSTLFYAAGPFYGVCIGLAMPVNQSVVVKCAPANRWGVANSIFFLGQDVGIGLSVVLWGALNDTLGFNISLICVAVCVVASLVVAWMVYPGHGTRPLVARSID